MTKRYTGWLLFLEAPLAAAAAASPIYLLFYLHPQPVQRREGRGKVTLHHEMFNTASPAPHNSAPYMGARD